MKRGVDHEEKGEKMKKEKTKELGGNMSYSNDSENQKDDSSVWLCVHRLHTMYDDGDKR